MVKTLAYSAAGVFLFALLGAIFANQHTGGSDKQPPTPALSPRRAGSAGTHPSSTTLPDKQLVGSALNLYHTEHLDLYLNAIDQMADTGFNALLVVTPVFQTDGASKEVRSEVGPGKGPSDTDITALLSHAKSRGRGMRTVLMPQINFTEPRGNEWRGKLQPEHWAPWWKSYTRAIDRFLELAVENDVDVFVIGCELLTTHKPQHKARWRELIAHCRERFAGQLIYSTTWDTYHKVGFWDDLDAVGVSGYWDLTTLARDNEHPTPDELKRRWAQIKSRLLTFADTQGKPVLLTEVGYPSLPWALKDPWNYVNSDGIPADHDAQARGYAAFLAAWSDTIVPPDHDLPAANTYLPGPADPNASGAPGAPAPGSPGPRSPGPTHDPRSAGVFFHKWDPYHQGGPNDTGYGIVGKPTEPLLTDWLNGPWQSAGSATDR